MNFHKYFKSVALLLLCATATLSAFEKGWVLNMNGNVGGSLTIPSISDADLAYLGASKMEGTLGFIGGGGSSGWLYL